MPNDELAIRLQTLVDVSARADHDVEAEPPRERELDVEADDAGTSEPR